MKAGIIGSGNIAQAHLLAYRKLKEIECVCISNEGTARLSNFQDYRSYDTYKQMVEENKLDVVSICTPPFDRINIIKYLAEANINILCEPPMSMSYPEALEIKKIIENSDIQLMMGFSLRFSKWYHDAKQLIENGRLGDIIFCRWVYASAFPKNHTFFFEKKDEPLIEDKCRANLQNPHRKMSGIIFNKGCQIFDILTWFFNSPKTVDATFLNKRNLNSEENAFITFEHPSSVSQVSLSYGTNIHPNRPLERIEIYGTACNLIMDHSLGIFSFLPASKHILLDHLLRIPEAAIRQFFMNKKLNIAEDIYYREISYFINSIKNKKSLTSTYLDGLNNVSIMDESYRSINAMKTRI